MNPIFLLCISIAFAVINNLLFHGFKNRDLRGIGDILLFNALISVVWIVILTAVNRGAAITARALIWGITYGIATAAFLLCKMQAMATGPVALTSFIGCSSLLISTAFGVIYFKEDITLLQLVGVLLLSVALFLTVAGSEKENSVNAGRRKRWLLWCGLFFLCSGATGIIFKLHQSSDSRDEVNQMMLCAAVTSAVLLFAAAVAVQLKADRTLPKIGARAVPFVLACGIVSCGYNRLNISLAGMLPSIIFFPLFNGSVILLASLSAGIIFKEKITLRQAVGMLIGIVALLSVSGVFDM